MNSEERMVQAVQRLGAAQERAGHFLADEHDVIDRMFQWVAAHAARSGDQEAAIEADQAREELTLIMSEWKAASEYFFRVAEAPDEASLAWVERRAGGRS